MIQQVTMNSVPFDNGTLAQTKTQTQKNDDAFRTLIAAKETGNAAAGRPGRKSGLKSGPGDDAETANCCLVDVAQIAGSFFVSSSAGGNSLSGMYAANGLASSDGSDVAGISSAVGGSADSHAAAVLNLSAIARTNQDQLFVSSVFAANPMFSMGAGTLTQQGIQSVLPKSDMSANISAPAISADQWAAGSGSTQILSRDMQTSASDSEGTATTMTALSSPGTPGSADQILSGSELSRQNTANGQAQSVGFTQADIHDGTPVTGFNRAETGSHSNTGTSDQNPNFSDSKQSTAPSSEKAVSVSLHAVPAAQYMTGQAVVPVSDESSQLGKSVAVQVSNQIAVNYHKDKTEFQIDLYPETLGKVSVKLSMDNNVLTVKISADDAKTQSLLLSQADRIQTALQDSTSQTVHIVSQDKQWYEQDGYTGNSQHQQQQQQQGGGNSGQRDDESGTEDFLTVMQRLRVSSVI